MTEASSANVWSPLGTAPLDGFFKKRWAPQLAKLIPTQTKIQADIPFSSQNRLGDEYIMPVEMTLEHGFTYAGSTDDAFTLAGSVRGSTKNAKIRGSQHVLQTVIGYKAAYSAASNEQAFENITKNRVRNMWLSMHKRLEIDLLYGQDPGGLGLIEAYTADTNLAQDATPNHSTFTITAATWAPGIWAGMVGAKIDIVPTALTHLHNVDGSSIVAVDIENRMIECDDNHDANGSAAATDLVVLRGQVTPGTGWNTMKGFNYIAGYTGTDLFNISTAYDQWKPITQSCSSGDLSFPLINDGIAKFVSKGGDGDLIIYVNPRAWTNMNSDIAALRRFDASYSSSKAEEGVKEIVFNSLNGKVTLKPHTMIKEGIALGIQPDEWMRIGATDITFDRASMGGNYPQGSYFRELTDHAGFELRAYSDQALFTECPAHFIRWTAIVNS